MINVHQATAYGSTPKQALDAAFTKLGAWLPQQRGQLAHLNHTITATLPEDRQRLEDAYFASILVVIDPGVDLTQFLVYEGEAPDPRSPQRSGDEAR